jgi:hypothetical protein
LNGSLISGEEERSSLISGVRELMLKNNDSATDDVSVGGVIII